MGGRKGADPPAVPLEANAAVVAHRPSFAPISPPHCSTWTPLPRGTLGVAPRPGTSRCAVPLHPSADSRPRPRNDIKVEPSSARPCSPLVPAFIVAQRQPLFGAPGPLAQWRKAWKRVTRQGLKCAPRSAKFGARFGAGGAEQGKGDGKDVADRLIGDFPIASARKRRRPVRSISKNSLGSPRRIRYAKAVPPVSVRGRTMLTLPGRPYRLCDRLTRRSFLRIGGLALGGLSLPQLLRRSRIRRHPIAQVRHHGLPVGRPAASGHGGSQARRARRDSRRVQADRHQRSRHRDLRAAAAPGRPDGPPGRPSFRGRLGGAARGFPVHDRPTAGPAAAGRLAVARLDRGKAARAGHARPCRRSSACRRR